MLNSQKMISNLHSYLPRATISSNPCPFALLAVPTGAITAAVPHANISEISPEQRHRATLQYLSFPLRSYSQDL